MITTRALSHINTLESKIPIWINEILIEKKEDILNILKYSQLGVGKNSYGKALKFQQGNTSGNGFYAPSTQEIANSSYDYSYERTKTNGDAYNFNWSGNTFNFMDMRVEMSKKTFEIFTTGGKQSLLEKLYGEIFTLTKEHNFWVNKNILEPYVAKKISENLFSFK